MKDNLLPSMDAETTAAMLQRILDTTKNDLDDRAEWDAKVEAWTKLWNVQPPDRVPAWEDGSNVCVPLLVSACEQSHDRAYSAYFDQPTAEQVRVRPVEEMDVEIAMRVEKTMNWQVTTQIDEWEAEHDRLLTALPRDGVAWKMYWWDERPRVCYVPGADVIVPYGTKPYRAHEARRLTYRYFLHATEIEDKIRDGYFYVTDETLREKIEDAEEVGGQYESVLGGDTSIDAEALSPAKEVSDSIEGFEPTQDETSLHTIYQRHERILMGDKMVPVIVWVDQTDERVLRVESRDEDGREVWQFVDYHFIPSPTGFYSYGYGHFLGPLNQIANTIFNQYIDAGRVANQPFVLYTPGAGFRKSSIRLRPGEGVQVRDIDQVKIEKLAGLDGSLAQLLGIIDKYGSDISNNTEEARGRVQKGVREPTVRGQMGRLEQTLMGFGVKVQRMLRSTRREFEILYNLDSIYLDDDVAWRIDGEHGQPIFGKTSRADFDKQLDLMPTASPGYTSKAQWRQETLDLMEVVLKLPTIGVRPDGSVGNPKLLDHLTRRLLQSFGHGEAARFLPPAPRFALPPGVEHQQWLEGNVPRPTEEEDHAEHLTAHRLFLMTNTLDEKTRLAILLHLEETHALLAAKMQAPAPAAPTASPAGEERTDFAGQPPMPEMA